MKYIYWYIMYYITYQYFIMGPNDTRFAQAISGPKKSRFSGPTPSNAPHNDVAPLKTIMYRAIKTTGTLIVIKIYQINFLVQ
jgi:hypothetical protein